ncbi:metallophosphoesterase [Ruminococcus sp.]|uniref:metallophosphoesterase n=1 Tax=Ruminococcus sp. TaxID=41978 RepID=UPI0025FB9348|nr:metallophosphoesterase [Ruminococcus sp.]
MFWLILFALAGVISLGSIFYLLTRFHKFGFVQKIAENHKKLSWLLCLVPLIGIGCFGIINTYAVVIIVFHLAAFWLIADLLGKIVRKIIKKERRFYIEGVLTILFTAVYLTFGWINAHDVKRTAYTVHTDKPIAGGSLRIVGIADSHLGITLNGEQFAKEMKRIQAEEPDVVVVAGDFVDDDSCREDMVQACKALGELKTTYGVYFTIGNHDKGYYESGHRDFTIEDLYSELEKNNVTLLEDDVVEVNDTFRIVGRLDKHYKEREDIKTLTKDLDNSKFELILDHQPNDYDNEAAAGADLVFSGHTHGGHIWPSGYIGLLIGANDFVYGSKTIDNTKFIVTSGISGWAIPFKTGCISEYVVMDVTN